mgnify:CR=1 FL=1
MVDKRDETTWATLELTRAGEQKAIEGKLAESLRGLLSVDDTFPIFVPYATYTKGGRTVSVRLIEGYAFVATGLPEIRYFSLEKSPLVARVFSSENKRGMRVLHTLTNDRIQGMRDQLTESLGSDIEVGSHVRVIGGNYRGLEGTVVDLFPDQKKVAVQVDFRSLTSLVVIPSNLVVFSTTEDTADGVNTSPSEGEEEMSLDELVEGGKWT